MSMKAMTTPQVAALIKATADINIYPMGDEGPEPYICYYAPDDRRDEARWVDTLLNEFIGDGITSNRVSIVSYQGDYRHEDHLHWKTVIGGEMEHPDTRARQGRALELDVEYRNETYDQRILVPGRAGR